MEIKLILNGLDCANCANKIAEIKEESIKDEIINEIKSIVKKLEPHVNVEEKTDNKEVKNNTKTCTSSCCSGDNHHHERSIMDIVMD